MTPHLAYMAAAVGLSVMGGVAAALLGLLAYAKKNSGVALVVIAPILMLLNGAQVADGFWVYALDGSHNALFWSVCVMAIGSIVGWAAFIGAVGDGNRR